METCYQCYISKTDEKKKKEVGGDFESLISQMLNFIKVYSNGVIAQYQH